MKNNQTIGTITSLLFYFLELIMVILSCISNKSIGMCTLYLAIGLWILSIFIMNGVKKCKFLSPSWAVLLEKIFSAVLGVFLSYAVDNSSLIFGLFAIQWMTSLFFWSIRLCLALPILQIITLFLMHFFISVHWTVPLNTSMFYAAIVAVFMLTWIEYTLIHMVSSIVNVYEQKEQSLRDMRKISDALCQDAKKATKSKSEFLSNMSHEIRTPINAILGMNEMILRECKEDSILSYAENVESSGKMLLSLINDILDFSKIESGKMELFPVKYQLSSVINDLINMSRPRAVEKGLSFELEIDPRTPEYLYGDEVRIRQIVTNILTNAIKYTDTGYVKLRIYYTRTGVEECRIFFEVSDSGRGIKEEDQHTLFQAFQRVDEKNNRGIEGTGLGLAITNRFVQMMQGTLSVKSTYGKGSTFTAMIPQKITRNDPIGDFVLQLEKAHTERKKYQELFTAPDAHILVVDDTAVNLVVVENLLKPTQVQITSVSSGTNAINKLRSNEDTYDLILLDHLMPGLDGVQTLERMKEQHLIDHIPVIALTANAVSGAREMYLDYGFSDYLTKPIVGQSLEQMLLRWLPKDKIKSNT